MVFGRNHRYQCFAVCKCQDRYFRTGDKLLYNDLVAGLAKHLILHNGVHCIGSLVEVLGNDNALAQRQTVCFYNYWIHVVFFNECNGIPRIAEYIVSCGWDVVFLHQILGEHLTSLDDCCGSVGTKCLDAGCFYCVYHACCQRVIRCNKYQVDLMLLCKGYHAVNVHGFDVHTLGIAGNTAVTRRTVQLLYLWAFQQLANNGVFSSAAANY